ncbi:MAG: hypothetical protein AAGG75_27240 [Bacteroidota bacterium]
MKFLQISVATLLLLMCSCSKEAPQYPHTSTSSVPLLAQERSTATKTHELEAFTAGHGLLFRQYMLYGLGKEWRNPASDFLGPEVGATYAASFDTEQSKLDAMGYQAYIDSQVDAEKFTEYLGAELKRLNELFAQPNYQESTDYLQDIRTAIGLEKNRLLQSIDVQEVPVVLDVEGSGFSEATLMLIVYQYLDNLAKVYESGAAINFRQACSFRQVLEDVIQGVTVGAGTGAIIGEIVEFFFEDELEIKVFGVELSATIIGGIVGGFVGLFNGIFGNKECDCGQADFIRIINDGEEICTPEVEVEVVGSGDDADTWEWTVTEGNSTATFITTVPRLTVRQFDPNSGGIRVTSKPLCTESDPDFIIPELFDLFALASPNATAGNLSVNWPQVSTIWAAPGSMVSIQYIVTDILPFNRQISFSIPPSLGTITNLQQLESLQTNWIMVQLNDASTSGSVTITSTNLCSGASTSVSRTIIAR